MTTNQSMASRTANRPGGKSAAGGMANQAMSRSAAGPAANRGLATALGPLVIDVGVPVGSYYLLHGGFGLSVWLSLALSSIGPAVRAVTGIVAERKLNLLALLMLGVNLAGIVVS